MFEDYCRVIEENRQLNEALQNCGEAVQKNINIIAKLENVVRALERGTHSDDSVVEMTVEFENLQQRLIEKDETIEHLMVELENIKLQLNECEKSKDDSTHSQSVTNSSNTMDFLEASLSLKNKICDLEMVSSDIERVFLEKMSQMREQQSRIDELSKQLESRTEPSPTASDECESIYFNKLKEMTERDQILAQKASTLEEEITLLIDERKKLMEINNELMKTVSICQSQVCAYDFDQ